jgi:hypothetical protein
MKKRKGPARHVVAGVGIGLAVAAAGALVALDRIGRAIKEAVLEEYDRRVG